MQSRCSSSFYRPRPSSCGNDDADTNLRIVSSTACCMLLSCSAASSLMHDSVFFNVDSDFFAFYMTVTLSAVIVLLPFLSHARTTRVVASLSSEQVTLLDVTYFVQYHFLSCIFLLHITISLTKPFQHWGFFIHLSLNTNVLIHIPAPKSVHSHAKDSRNRYDS